MEQGETKPAITIEPIEVPGIVPTPAPSPETVPSAPSDPPVEVPEREKVPA